MRSQAEKICTDDVSDTGDATQRKCAANSPVAAPLDTHPDDTNAVADDRSELAPRCPACSRSMQQQRCRLFLCAPCRQTIETFEVVEHQYLICRQPSVKLRQSFCKKTGRIECDPDHPALSGKQIALSLPKRVQIHE